VRPIVIRPAAAAEIEEAFLWYYGQRPALGDDLLAAISRVFDRIVRDPMAYAVIYRETRRALVRRFPYSVFYRVYDHEIVVIACMHARRDPRRWQTRI